MNLQIFCWSQVFFFWGVYHWIESKSYFQLLTWHVKRTTSQDGFFYQERVLFLFFNKHLITHNIIKIFVNFLGWPLGHCTIISKRSWSDCWSCRHIYCRGVELHFNGYCDSIFLLSPNLYNPIIWRDLLHLHSWVVASSVGIFLFKTV